MLMRPLHDPLPLPLQQRGYQALEALAGLNAQEQLELACRTVVGVLMAARPHFSESAHNRVAYDTLCDAVQKWLRREIGPLRFARPQ